MADFQLIKALVNRDDPVIVEIGSHYGEDTLRFLEVFGRPSIFCFEPDPRNFEILTKYVTDDHIELFDYAVTDVDNETVDFYQSYIPLPSNKVPKKYDWIVAEDYFGLKINSSGASSLKKGYPGTSSVVKVKTIRLDTWANERGLDTIDLLWVDVQGGEEGVIKGLIGIADRIRYIWIEYGEDQYDGYLSRQETVKRLDDLGFKLKEAHSSHASKGDLLFKRKK